MIQNFNTHHAGSLCETVNLRHEKEYVIDSLPLALRVEEQGMGFAKQRQQVNYWWKESLSKWFV